MNVTRCTDSDRIIVGIGEMNVSDDPEKDIVTYSLGSCLGVTIFDPVAKVGGMIHLVLPDSSIQKNNPQINPYMFVNTGIPRFFKAAYNLGATKSNIIVKVAGGAEIQQAKNIFNIGARNITSLESILSRNNVSIRKREVGGYISRTVRLNMKTGAVTISSPELENRIL